jgi:trehalose/maltose hydrolase-like predicted phosphorylase
MPGAWYGWICDDRGNELTPHEYRGEIHINAWVLLSAAHSAWPGEDAAWQQEVFPLIEAVADAICARATRSEDGVWHIRNVIPPDESVVEDRRNPGRCDDSLSTNLAFRTALRSACDAAQSLNHRAPALWSEVANGLFIQAPGPGGIIPEYTGYSGHPIKQADVILAFWPLEADYPDEIVRANLEYYRERVLWGPLMTEQIDACIRLRHGLGEREAILRDLITRYRRYVRGAFEVPYECIDNSNSLMLTACGGLIQALVHGWFHSSASPRLGAT